MNEFPEIEGIIIFVCIIFSFLFSGTETALLSLAKHKIHQAIEEKKTKNKLLKIWHNNPNKVLVSILIGNNLMNISASALATDFCYKIIKNIFNITDTKGIFLALVIGIMTLLILTFGEILPKVYARANPQKILRLSFIVYAFYIITIWATNIFNFVSKKLLEFLGVENGKRIPSITETDLRTIFHIGKIEGGVPEDKAKMLSSIIELSKILTKEIMVPRTEIIALEEGLTLQNILNEIDESRFSRYPVYKENLDNITGFFYVKDLTNYFSGEKKDQFDIKNFIHPPFFVPETKNAAALLKDFQKKQLHIAIVVDEFGGTSGLITLEDVIEEIVGEIYDEYDEEEPLISKIDERHFIVQARSPLKELGDYLHIDFPEQDDYETVGGFIITSLGKVPEKGETLTYKDLKFKVRERAKTHVISVEIEADERKGEK